jgi:hypothetical protein
MRLATRRRPTKGRDMTTQDPQPRLIEVEEFFTEPRFIVPTISPDGTR